MALPPPEYPEPIDYDLPVESWTIRFHKTGNVHKLILFPSRRRKNCFRIVVDGKEWTKCMGYDRTMRNTVKSLSR